MLQMKLKISLSSVNSMEEDENIFEQLCSLDVEGELFDNGEIIRKRRFTLFPIHN